MPKMHTHAPLPFIGQKRAFLKPYIQTLHALIPDDGTGWTILDAFGGSGLLSHAAKHRESSITISTVTLTDCGTLTTSTVCAGYWPTSCMIPPVTN